MSIQDELNQIKSAVYGADVRDAIHDGVEKGYNKASQAESNSLDIKQTYDEILMNWNSDPNKDPEVIAARGGLPQLEDRLDATEQELNDLKNDPLKSRNIYTDYYYPTDPGQTGDIWIVLIDEDNLIPISKEEWEQGSIEGASGDNLDGEIRIRTSEPFEVQPSTNYVFSFENLYNDGVYIQGRVFEYDSAGNFVQVSSPSWVNTPFSLSTASGTNKCKVIFKWTTDAAITEEVILNIKPSFKAV